MPLPLTDSHNISHGHVFIQTRRSRRASRGTTPRCEHATQHCGCVSVSFGGRGNRDSTRVKNAQQREAGEPRQQTAPLTLASRASGRAGSEAKALPWSSCFIRGYASNRGPLSYFISWGHCRSPYCSEQEKPSHVFHSRAGGPRRTEPFQPWTGGNVSCSLFISANKCDFVNWF